MHEADYIGGEPTMGSPLGADGNREGTAYQPGDNNKKAAFECGLTCLSIVRRPYCFGGVLVGVFGAGAAGLVPGADGLAALGVALPAGGAGTPDCTL